MKMKKWFSLFQIQILRDIENIVDSRTLMQTLNI